ncbi:MAG: alanine--tRNA ligase [Omnitrophica bacterium RIFCSPLOWO2_01_FULL_50_24]|nr:MAG: alanine--tRNA ligase [Omnitrophica bacterium RIFCSPLOWO2_01_FULL_50_24]
MKTQELRARFLDFFKQKGHTIVKSDSLVPHNDPTLLFTGAGMNQFKDYFLGTKKDLKRAVSVQKCLRTGDLDVVGVTPYHHSFFEMLGNFSFGDYFKREAIEWAWDFLTKELKLKKNKLFVSVHADDHETYKIWNNVIGIPKDSIARLGDRTNFWPADAPKLGPNGPCGPCSEIFYDQGAFFSHSKGRSWTNDTSGRYAEIWNLVFTQSDRQDDGTLTPLKMKCIDTGLGLERLACVMQGKENNFQIDTFLPLLDYLTKVVPKGEKANSSNLNAIADHVRAAVVAINDGVYPSNESRGYVIRKLIRRAVWKGRVSHLPYPWLPPLVPIVVDTLKDAYPELKQSEKSIVQMVGSEEDRFHETLESGLEIVSKLVRTAKNRKEKQLSGEEVFRLYDTFGFPDELTRTIASESKITIDEAGFTSLLEKQRTLAKKSSKLKDSIFVAQEVNQELQSLPKTKFLGYDSTEATGRVVWTSFKGKEGIIVLDQTPFYPEAGGQVGDRGTLENKKFIFQVIDTRKDGKVILHYGTLTKGKPAVNEPCRVVVDLDRRNAAKRNHTATHLLQAALRQVLGSHVRQVGSLVNPDKLRFDFTHGKPLTADELEATERWVNEAVLECTPVQPRQESYDAALKEGALAFFGDKYTERVRTINIKNRSKELCGGTHCSNTGEIGAFIITSESSIGSGIRRLEAITGLNAIQYTKSMNEQIEKASSLLKSSPDQLLSRIESLTKRVREFERTKSGTINTSGTSEAVDELIRSTENVGTLSLIRQTLSGISPSDLRLLSDRIRAKTKKCVVVLMSQENAKINFVVALTPDLAHAEIDAKKIAQALASHIQGSAGGHKDFAQGGGRDPEGIAQAFNSLPKLLGKGSD